MTEEALSYPYDHQNQDAKPQTPPGAGFPKKDSESQSGAAQPQGQKFPIETNFIRLRGLPYVIREEEIRQFLSGIKVTNIYSAPARDGRPSGEAYCELNSLEDVELALNEYNMKEINSRYIEIFDVNNMELNSLKRSGLLNGDDRVIRLRGLPFSATEADIVQFLQGLTCEEVVIGQTGGRPSGEAFIRLGTKEEAGKALDFNRKTMGTRYIEVFRTNEHDLEHHRNGGGAGRAPPPPAGYSDFRPSKPSAPGGPKPLMSVSVDYPGRDYDYDYGGGPHRSGGGRGGSYRSQPYESRRGGRGSYGGRGGGNSYGGSSSSYGGGSYGSGDDYGWNGGSRRSRSMNPNDEDFMGGNKIYIRGVPFSVSSHEIEAFFAPLKCVEIKIGYNSEGRPSGDAAIEFPSNEDVRRSFEKNRQYLGRRYVEIFTAREVPPPMRNLTWQVIGGNPTARKADVAPPPPPPPADDYYGSYAASARSYAASGAGAVANAYAAASAPVYGGSSAPAYPSQSTGGYGDGGYGAAAYSNPSAASYGGYGQQEYRGTYAAPAPRGAPPSRGGYGAGY